PRPPRAVDRAVPAELETIVLKAVGKSPADRYATARALADDLRRFVDNQPILARRPTVAVRVRKWARRHPSVVMAIMVVLGLARAGLVLSNALTQAAYDRGRQRAAEARQRAEEAEEQYRLAKQVVDEMIQISEQELAGNPQHEALRKRLLESVLAYYQKFIE